MALLVASLDYFPVLTRYLSPPSMFNEGELYAQLEIFITYIVMLKYCYFFSLNEQCQNNPLFTRIVLLPSGLSHGTVSAVSGLLSCANQVFETPFYV